MTSPDLSIPDMENEVKEDKLLQGNVKTAITFITPFIPFIGLVTGGATVGKHVMRKQSEASEQSRPQGENKTPDEEL